VARIASIVVLNARLAASSIAQAQTPVLQAESPLSALVGNYEVAPGHVLGIDLYPRKLSLL
jgi:hypothetical protein